MGGFTATAHDRLRERLTLLRDEALDRMLRRGTVEPGHLPLIAGIAAALNALDTMPVEAAAAARAVVSADSREIRLTLYSEVGAVATVALDPVRATALAQRLIGAALPRLCSPSCNWQPSDGSQNRPAAARGRATADESGGPVPRRGKC
jgi:hypothetical protein